jgi:hypothetical protein
MGVPAPEPEIEAALNRATVAVLLISPGFLNSRFIHDTEVPRLLERRTAEGVRVIPVFVHPCAWKAVGWLTALQGRPSNGRVLSELRRAQAETHLAELALEIRDLLGRGVPPVGANFGSERSGRGVPPQGGGTR